MNCSISKLDLCFLEQETFKTLAFNFGELDVSKDKFTYIVYRHSQEVKRISEDIKIASPDVYIEPFRLPLGNYWHELIWEKDGINLLVFQGRLKITNKSTQDECVTCDNYFIIKVNDGVSTYEIGLNEIYLKGPKGEPGPEGPKGKEGPRGDSFVYSDFTSEQLALLKGERGEQGVQGEKGVQGNVGKQGEKGVTGLQGDKGLKGEQGVQGEKGIQGDKGAKGEAGQNIIDQNTKTPIMIWTGTKAQYDAISVKDPVTLYIIKP